jgi:hypothetical protein
MSPTGRVTNLYSFCAQTDCTDGQNSGAELVQATDGNFYGTTQGSHYHSSNSAIFSISPEGTFTRLYTFNKNTLLAANGGLVQATDGSFFGTTGFGFASCS